jgi:hypothetical protein
VVNSDIRIRIRAYPIRIHSYVQVQGTGACEAVHAAFSVGPERECCCAPGKKKEKKRLSEFSRCVRSQRACEERGVGLHIRKGTDRWVAGWAWRVHMRWVTKELRFWQKRSPNCDFLVLHSPSTLSTSINKWRVGPVWGVRRTRFGWEKFSIVFAHYPFLR